MCAHFTRFSFAIRLATLKIARATTGYPLGVTAPHAPTQSELMQALESKMGFGRRRSPAGSPLGIMTPLEALLLDAQKERHEANQLMGPRSPYEGPFATARSPPLPLLANDLYPHGSSACGVLCGRYCSDASSDRDAPYTDGPAPGRAMLQSSYNNHHVVSVRPHTI